MKSNLNSKTKLRYPHAGTHGMVNRGIFSLNKDWGGDSADGMGNASNARAHGNASFYFYNPE